MKSVLVRLAVLTMAFAGLFSSGAMAADGSANGCTNASWEVSAHKMGQILHLTLREKTQQGALCDLVVNELAYSAAGNQLAVQVAPTEYCPVDAIGHRTATVMWNLPQNLRGETSLNLLVNGIGIGQLHLDSKNVRFMGGCL